MLPTEVIILFGEEDTYVTCVVGMQPLRALLTMWRRIENLEKSGSSTDFAAKQSQIQH